MTTTTTATAAAAALGQEFAARLNATPAEAQNWSPLSATDDLPEEDYRTLAREYGDVTPEMARAYRAGFNATFVAPAVECAYCGADIPESVSETVPKSSDDEAWERLAHNHTADCEWIATRAHQVDRAD